MIKRLLMIVVLAAALRIVGLLPFETNDVARLKPVEALVVMEQDGRVVLTGGDHMGIGSDWDTALRDLRRSAAGSLFLGTAEQVVLCGNTKSLLQEIAESEALRPAAAVVYCPDRTIDAKQTAAYLSSRDAGLTLRQVQASILRREMILLPVIRNTEGGLRLDGAGGR